MKSSVPLPASIHHHKDIEDVTQRLFDKLAIFAVPFSTIAASGSFFRIFRFGWNPNIIVDIVTYILVLLLFSFRRRFNTRKIAAVFLIIILLDGCITFFFSGLINVNLTLITSACVVLGALFGIRRGIIALVFCLISIITVATFYITGHLKFIYDLDSYLHTPHAWISQISGFFVYALAGLAVVHYIQMELWNSIRKLRQRSNELLESEKKYRLLTDTMRDVLLLLDTNYTITHINPSCMNIFGYSPEELHRKPITLLCPEKQRRHLTSRLDECVHEKNGKECPSFECQLQRKDTVPVSVEFTPTIIRDSQGSVIGIQAIIRDMSDKKRTEEEKRLLEQQLRQSEKLEVIGQLAGGIAHDFNNQLAGILGFAEIITSDSEKESEVRASAESIVSIARQAGDLTGKLLAFARKGNYLLSTIDLHVMINEIATILSHSIDPGIAIKRKLKARHYYISADAGQLQNALLNIALNARDAMPHGGLLQFSTVNSTIGPRFSTPFQSTVVPGQYLHLIIADTGSGIKPAVIRKIFEPFFTTKDTGKGTGMGLAAVYGTIQAHHGIIDVVSGYTGTAFHIYLPVCTDKQPDRPVPRSETVTSGTGTILLIEDEASVRKMMTMVIKKLGYDILSFAEGTSAVTYYRKSADAFDGVILDLMLPGMSGKETLQQLRAISPDIPVLICSGYSADKEVQHMLRDKKTFFIHKPFTMSELSHRISILTRTAPPVL
jgi:two-component system, cell cycle sensor histidine kinase and response regulator CckA